MTSPSPFVVDKKSSSQEERGAAWLAQMLRQSAVPDDELTYNLGLYLTRQALSRILMLDELYRLMLPVHGVIMEFGVRWGQSLAVLTALRGQYEPYNYPRRIIGFDTFSGFPAAPVAQDGVAAQLGQGAYGIAKGHFEALQELLAHQEAQNPIPHLRKHELVVGDACQTIHQWLEANPETVVAMAYFDFDIYEPTKACLQAIRSRLTRGAVVAFDEVCFHSFPGETLALMEVLGIDRVALRRTTHASTPCYFIVD